MATQMELVSRAVESSYCDARWKLYHEWVRQSALKKRRKPNSEAQAHRELFDHQTQCLICRERLATFHELAKQAYITGDIDDEQEPVPTPE